jgi:hypothetical protein
MGLSDEQLKSLKFDYVSGVIPLKRLAEIYEIGTTTLKTIVNSEGWPKRSPANGKPRPKPKGKPGRPTKLTTKLKRLTFRLCLLGCNDKEIYEALEITAETFYKWKREDESFSEILAIGRNRAHAAVARAMYKRATGFVTTEEKAMVVDKEVEIVKIKKHYVPDVTAGFKWLSRRKPDDWSETKNINLNDKTLRTEIPPETVVEDDNDFNSMVESQLADE